MAGNRGTYADGPQPYHGGDPNRDISTILAAVDRIVSDLYGGQNVVLSGFALSIVSGMQIQVGAGVCYASGIFAVTAPQTLNIATTSANPRYTLIRVTVTPNNPNGTDLSTGNNLLADTNVVDYLDGTAASTPGKPTLGSAYQVQVGSLLLPANTTALTSGMLNTLDCAPNSLYDPSPLSTANSHRAASYGAGTTIHGVVATAPGALGAGRLLVGDSTHGATGAALTVIDAAGIARNIAQPGTNPAFYVAGYDSSGRVADSELLQGQDAAAFDSAGSANAVQANLNGHAGSSPKTTAGVHNFNYDCGVFTPSATDTTVNFNFAWPVAPTAVWVGCAWGAPAPGGFPTGFCKGTPGTTSFVAHVSTTGVPYMWIAVR